MILELQYVAGLFDGEGWFIIKRENGLRYNHSRDYTFRTSAGLAMREKLIVESLKETFGGFTRKQMPTNENHSTSYRWDITGSGCLEFAQKLLPHLIAKREHAKIIIDFQNERNLNGNKPLTDERYNFYLKCYNGMKQLNKKGIGKEMALSVAPIGVQALLENM